MLADRLCFALGVLLFHAFLLVHVSAVALILLKSALRRYEGCEQPRGCGWPYDDGFMRLRGI